MDYFANGVKLPSETVAVLVMACIDVEDILQAGEVTSDVLEELEYILPELQRFINMQ